jgi:uncharacterized protein YjbI with pentapeptide repeats
MADPEQWAKLEESVQAWNRWRASQAITPDLSDLDFSRRDLSGANFRGADLRGVVFDGSNLSGANLREANLQGVDLSVAKRGLQTEQLAGADLTGATLPPALTKLYDSLENVNKIFESVRKPFLAFLAACLSSWLTIATTTDVALVTNNLITTRASSPIGQTSVPVVGFYLVAPLLLLCFYFYLCSHLQKLWEELGSLPAIFPDGRPLHAKVDPWLLSDLVRANLPKLNVNQPFLSYFQLGISVLLAWWVVPITMFLFWGRYLPRHERIGTTFHVALLAISVMAALHLYRLALATLRGAERRPFTRGEVLTSRGSYQTAGFAVAFVVLFGIVSWGAITGVPSNAPILGVPLVLRRIDGTNVTGPLTWVPRLMALVGYSPFANLEGAEVSQKKSTWSKDDRNLDSVAGVQMRRANLRYALASKAFFAGVNLGGADLSGAQLWGADLHDADLRRADLHRADVTGTDLTGAYLSGSLLDGADLRTANLGLADLSDAHLVGADLREARFDYADLTYADFQGAKNLNLEGVKKALHWEQASTTSKFSNRYDFPPTTTLGSLRSG